MALLAYQLLIVVYLTGSVFGAPAAGKKTEVTKDGIIKMSKSHYKVVAVPDDELVTRNGTDFSGVYVDVLNTCAQLGNFTYDITIQADGNYGKKQANGKFNGMIGDIVSGKYDILLGTVAFTKDVAQVLSGAVFGLNLTEWTLWNPKKGTGKKDYITRKDVNYFVIKNSEDPATKAIWANIKDRLPGSIVADTDEAVKQVKAGKFFVADNDTITDLAAANPDLAKDPKFVSPGIPVYPFATKKGSDIGVLLNSLIALGSDDDMSNELADYMLAGGLLPGSRKK